MWRSLALWLFHDSHKIPDVLEKTAKNSPLEVFVVFFTNRTEYSNQRQVWVMVVEAVSPNSSRMGVGAFRVLLSRLTPLPVKPISGSIGSRCSTLASCILTLNRSTNSFSSPENSNRCFFTSYSNVLRLARWWWSLDRRWSSLDWKGALLESELGKRLENKR